MRVALTGVPGTGKTSVAERLKARGVRVVHLNDFARDAGLLSERDEARGSYLVDVDDLADRLNEALAAEARDVVVEGHFAHEMDVDAVVLLRCDPRVLVERLRGRGWSEAKVRENVEAEALDVLAQEVLDGGLPAAEIDASARSVDEVAAEVARIVETPPQGFKGSGVGTVAWPLESLPWS
ncbi:MAG TPA: adenylate kinase family protein [Candidatus Thermoplasmatota archaeon]|nr:adenylate kinase family protein [Candidatus Thermoplasmatota archaeon]